MNTLDLIVCLVLALAVWNGWRQGFVVQICSLAGIVAGIWIAARFGAQVGGWLRLDDEVAAAGGFVSVLVVVILVVAIAGRVVRKVFHFAGLGVADTLLGIAVSVLVKSNDNLKTGIVISFAMLGSFLSGMMGITMKYTVDTNAPFINKINPVSMITDGL